MRLVEASGIRIATQAFGDSRNPAVLLIMGATASMLGWPDDFCVTLSDRGFNVIRFDHRDTGQSTTVPPGQASYSVEDIAADTIDILNAYDLERAHFIGMSLGGYIAQMVAVRHPDRVRSLTLIASEPLGWDGPTLPNLSQEILAHFSEIGCLDWSSKADVTDFLLKTERLCAGSGQIFDEQHARARISEILSRTSSPASMFNHASLGLRESWTGRYQDIRSPVLVLHGTDDPVLPLENGKAIFGGIGGAKLAVMPGVGHELPHSQLEFMVDIISDHLAR